MAENKLNWLGMAGNKWKCIHKTGTGKKIAGNCKKKNAGYVLNFCIKLQLGAWL